MKYIVRRISNLDPSKLNLFNAASFCMRALLCGTIQYTVLLAQLALKPPQTRPLYKTYNSLLFHGYIFVKKYSIGQKNRAMKKCSYACVGHLNVEFNSALLSHKVLLHCVPVCFYSFENNNFPLLGTN